MIILMLFYTATYMPYQICFIDKNSQTAYTILEYVLDTLFGFDIIINFITAIEKPDGTIEARLP